MHIRLAILALLAAGTVHSGEVHQHGVAQMTVAIEGDGVVVELVSPMENLVGFEHAPRNDRQRKAIQAMKDRFGKPETLLLPSAAAGCRARPAELELPGDRQSGGHADLHATIQFRCATPAALKEIDVRLFDAFPRLERIKAQVAAPARQVAAELTQRRARLAW